MPLPPGALAVIDAALAEDVGPGDFTTLWTVPEDRRAEARIVAKSPGVIAGSEVAAEVFRRVDPLIEVTVDVVDGTALQPGDVAMTLRGSARSILTGERTALNFMQRLSGVATVTRRYVRALEGTGARVIDTRKTTPGLRALEKYAVRAGGGVNHRGGLDQGILIKDNHIRLAGGVKNAVTRMRQINREMPTEVEAQSLEQVDDALAAGADIILLDNLSTADLTEAVKRCAGRVKTEISGGVTLSRMPELAETGADYVSIGALTHSAPAVDLSFEIEPA